MVPVAEIFHQMVRFFRGITVSVLRLCAAFYFFAAVLKTSFRRQQLDTNIAFSSAALKIATLDW
jgi:hypothetical protein